MAWDDTPPTKQELAPRWDAEPPPSKLDSIAAKLKEYGSDAADVGQGYLSGINNAITLGYQPQIQGALGAASDFVSGNMGSDSFGDRYLKNRDAFLAADKKVQDRVPIAYGAGQLIGGAAIPIPGAAAETALGKVATAGLKGAGLGTVINPGDKEGEINPLQLGARGESALYGGAFGSGLEGVVQGAPGIAKKAMNTILGVSEEGIGKYLQNRERINNAPTLATLKDTIDEQVGGLNNKVLRSEAQVAGARANLTESKALLGAEQKAQAFDYRNGAVDARNDLGLANRAVQEQTAQQEAQLAQTQHPRTMANDVHQAVATLKNQVVNESAKSRQILADSGAEIETKSIMENLKKSIDRMFGDTPAITPQAKAEESQLKGLYQDLSKLPPTLKGETAKNVVQQIDEQAAFNRDAGGFGSGIDQTLKGIRKGIDSQLKNNPEYAAQMQTVSEKTKLLENANHLFGTPEKANSALGTIASDAKLPQRGTLEALGQHTGKDFISPIENYNKAQGAIKGGFTPVEAGRAADRAQTLDDILSAPGYRESRIQSNVEASGLPRQVSEREAELARLQSQLGMAQAEAEPFRGWAPRSTQNKLESLRSRAPDKASIESQRELSMLNDMRTEGTPDYLQAIDDNRVRHEFSTDKTRGSRNVNLGKGVGGAIGALGGYLAHVPYATSVGAGIGAGVGGVVDKYGGAIAKAGLDKYLDNKASVDFARENAQRAVAPWLLMTRKDQ